ncbi:Tubulin-specific chaperone A [Meyerozyma sp. JA9]|nr:Tubulin-specific chaperone A [Meyerozyma sp. JA9]
MAPTKLEIKVNAVKRLLKESKLYDQEALEQEKVLSSMKERQDDPYLIQKQEVLLKEARMMVTELKKKVEEQKTNLSKYLDSYDGDEDTSAARALISAN